jgi:2-dehydro-3-deoxyphosphogluconate aldolase/(4S)-4-hydroxy-2-oxoglutarate aldolase
MDEVTKRIGLAGLVPVVKVGSAPSALDLAKALAAGGITVMEITFRSAAAADAIRLVRQSAPDTLVGAGTIINAAQLRQALEAGAQFIVSPGWVDEVVDACLAAGVPVYPGVTGPDGVAKALNRGLEVVKFFPAEASGGVTMLDALAGPFGGMKFMPTGGIDAENLASYAKKKYVHGIGGSWMVKPDLVDNGQWDEITRLSRAAVYKLHGFRLAHVGINSGDADQARAAAALLTELFGIPAKEGNSSIFAGKDNEMEIMKSPFRGTHGHLAIAVHNVERAAAYLATKGIKTVPETLREEGGQQKSVYLDLELNGFALHLVRL